MYLSQPRWDPQEVFFSLRPMREERSVIPTHTNIQLILSSHFGSMLKRNEERGHIPEPRITDLDRFRQTAGKTLDKCLLILLQSLVRGLFISFFGYTLITVYVIVNVIRTSLGSNHPAGVLCMFFLFLMFSVHHPQLLLI